MGSIKTFFGEMNEVISKAMYKYDNLKLMGDFNRDLTCSNSDKYKLDNFCNLLNLRNLVHSALWKVVSL